MMNDDLQDEYDEDSSLEKQLTLSLDGLHGCGTCSQGKKSCEALPCDRPRDDGGTLPLRDRPGLAGNH